MTEPSVSAFLRIIRTALAALGALLIAYAISDHPFYGGEPGFGKAQAVIAATGLLVALCAIAPRRMAASALLLVASSLLTLAVAETAGEMLLGPRHRPIYQADERLIFKFIPNRVSAMTHAAVNGGGTVTHRINSRGFRGEELRRTGEAARVVVYGDSFIHAFYTADQSTFVAQLGTALAAQLGAPVETINAGVSSYGPDQIALRMEHELIELRPDVAIVAIFAGNDYGDLLRNKIFRIDAAGRLAENRWKLDALVRASFDLSQRESILLRATRTVIRSTGPASRDEHPLNMDFLLAESEREYRSYKRNDDVTNTHVDYYSADVSLKPRSESARLKIRLMTAVLERIRDIAARADVPLVFLLIPHPLDVDLGKAADWGTVDRLRFPEYQARNQIAPLEAAAKALGVPFLSLYDLYRSRGADSVYLHGGDDHWNDAGQAIAASAMTTLLANRGLPRVRDNAVASPPK
jgi:hypothetical protein